MKFIYALAALAFFITSKLVLADEIDVLELKSQQLVIDQFLISEQALVQQGANLHKPRVAAGCLGTPLPSTPKTPNFTVIYNWTSTQSATLTFWHETC